MFGFRFQSLGFELMIWVLGFMFLGIVFGVQGMEFSFGVFGFRVQQQRFSVLVSVFRGLLSRV